jgi:type III secretion protein T
MEAFHVPLEYITAMAFALPRFLGVFAILPILTKEALPMTLRMGVVGCFAIFLVPLLLEGAHVQRSAFDICFILVRESLLGVFIGFVLSIPLWAVEAMGDLVDTQRGATIAESLNPLTGHETSPLGELFNQAVVTFLFVIGGFLLVLGIVFDSFILWPVFASWPGFGPDTPRVLLAQLDRFMLLTVLLSAPVVFSMFLAEAGMALISRFVPQLQVFFLAMPVKSAMAMFVFAIYAAVLFDIVHTVLGETFSGALGTVGQVFRPPRTP